MPNVDRIVNVGLLGAVIVLALTTAARRSSESEAGSGVMLLNAQLLTASGLDSLAAVRVTGRAGSVQSQIVEFVDVECPFCARYQPQLDSVALASATDVAIVNFPLPQHTLASSGAMAIACAERVGRGNLVSRVLLESQDSLASVSVFIIASRALQADSVILQSCMKEPVIEAAVREAVAVGRALGVRGTPSLVIKGVMFDGLPTANELRRLLSPDAMSSQEILKLARQMDAGRRKSSQR